MSKSNVTMHTVKSFCISIKEMAKRHTSFNTFFEQTQIIKKNQTTLKADEFDRLVSVASVEANLA